MKSLFSRKTAARGPSTVNKVSDFWGDERMDERKHHWLEHPVTRAWINMRVSGDASTGVAAHWKNTFFESPAQLALSLGCGFGAFERTAISLGLAERIEACDISEGAVAQARAYAAEHGMADRITYSVQDLDNLELPEGRYDAIFGISAIHHVGNLEGLFAACKAALKPGGLLLMDEYVGPARFQSRPETVQIINDILAILPEHYRRSIFAEGRPREEYANPPLSWFEENDPSEAIRSDEIIPLAKQVFDDVEFRRYGGAILHMLLSGTAGNFDPEKEAEAALLRVLAYMEERLETSTGIGSDFAAIVARRH